MCTTVYLPDQRQSGPNGIQNKQTKRWHLDPQVHDHVLLDDYKDDTVPPLKDLSKKLLVYQLSDSRLREIGYFNYILSATAKNTAVVEGSASVNTWFWSVGDQIKPLASVYQKEFRRKKVGS